MGKPEIEAFLTHLAVDRKVSPTTQYQAFSAKQLCYTSFTKWYRFEKHTGTFGT